jgi:hypothetical protein
LLYNRAMLCPLPEVQKTAQKLLLGFQFALAPAAALAQTAEPQSANNSIRATALANSPGERALAEATNRVVHPDRLSIQGAESVERSPIQDLINATQNFTKELEQEQGLSLERAIAVRQVLEHTVLLPIVVQISASQVQREQATAEKEKSNSLSDSILSLYRVLVAKLHQVQVEEPTDVVLLHEERLRHYWHIFGILNRAAPHMRGQIVDMLVEDFGRKDTVPMYQIVSDFAHYISAERELLGYSVPKYFDLIADSFRKQLSSAERLQGLHEDQIGCLLSQHFVMKRGIDAAVQGGHLTAAQGTVYRESIDETYVKGFLPHIATCIRSMRFQARGRPGGHLGLLDYPGAMGIESSAIRAHPITKGVEQLLAAWPGDRSELGTLYFDQLDSLSETHGDGNLVGCMSTVMLPLVAPLPERKRELIEALRAGLVDDASKRLIGETIDRPTQISRILGLCLISDHSYFATESNTRYNFQISPMLIRALKDDSTPLERYSAALTPAQEFFVELLRAAQGGEARELIPWIARYDGYTQEAVSIRARAVLTGLMNDLYSCQPATIFQESFLAHVAPFATPTTWDTSPIHPPARGREEQWRESVRTLFEYADIVSEHRLQIAPRHYSLFTLSMQLTEAVNRLRQRGSFLDRRNKDTLCPGAQTLSELYREPRRGLQDLHKPTFFETLERSIYQVARDTAHQAEVSNRSSEKLADVAHRYVEVLQRASLAEFVFLELNSADRDSLAALRVARRDIVEICDTLGFLGRDKHLQEILRADIEKVTERLGDYKQSLGDELSTLARQLGVTE